MSRQNLGDFLRGQLGEKTVEAMLGASSDYYDRHPMFSKVAYEMKDTKKRRPELVMHQVLGYAGQTLGEGSQRASTGHMKQLWITSPYMQDYECNYDVTWQLLDVADVMPTIKKLLLSNEERAMALAMKKDRVAAMQLNNGTSASQLYGDGKPLLSATQLTGDGSTYSNLSADASDLNETAIENAIKIIETWTDTGGKAIQPAARRIIAGTNLRFDSDRLLKTTKTLGSNDNDINAISTGRYLPEESLFSPHITNNGQFFIQTNVKNGLIMYTAKSAVFDIRPLPRSWDSEVVSLDSYVPTCGDKRCVYGYPAG